MTKAQKNKTKLNTFITVREFGAKCDGSTDDTAAVQAAIDYCAANGWTELVVPGPCFITSSLIVNRLVDTNINMFRIRGDGPSAGFYTTGNVTIFDSTIASPTDPQSEYITFENLQFRSSSVFNNSYVLSSKFLRIKFESCVFYLIRCVTSTIYAQSLYFVSCDIRNHPINFINVAGLYDVLFDACKIYNGSTLVRCLDASRGTNGLRLVNSLIENTYDGPVVVGTGAAGFVLDNCHLESNFSPEFDFSTGSISNKTLTFTANYIFNPVGITVKHGTTASVFSAGNTVTPNRLHSNTSVVTSLVSVSDNVTAGVSDATNFSVINGVYRAGNANDAWTHSSNHITKSTAGEFAFGRTPVTGVRGYFQGADQSASNYGLIVADSAGNASLLVRNDRQVQLLALGNYANDAAAAGAGIAVGSLYRNGSVVQVRVT